MLPLLTKHLWRLEQHLLEAERALRLQLRQMILQHPWMVAQQ